MQRITGLPDEQVLAYEAQAEAAMRAALEHVMDVIARRIEASMPVLASVLVAADQGDEIPPSDVPAGDGLPPGQPYVSPDDLASIPPLWQEAVTQQILPIVAQVFMDAAGRTHANMVDASSITSLPSVGSLAAEQYLARAQNTFEQVGDDLWATARTELSDGFERGESIPQLAERLRASAGVTARTGVLVARTQVNEASNAGSFATAQASGLKMQKEWIATPDLRTRPTHLAADGQRVDLNEPFIVGGYSAMFPAAPTLPPAERYNCRCTIGYVMPDRAPAQVRTQDLQDQQLADLPGTSALAEEVAPTAQVLGIRSALAEAKTLREVDQAAMTEARRLTGRDVRFDQRGSDVEIAREHAEGILRGLERYPESPISQVGTFGPGSSAELITRARGVPDFDEPKAFTATLPGNDVVLFNVRMASDPEAYQAALLRGHGAGWHANGTATPMGQALHEFGHTVDETFTEAGAKVGAVRSQMTVPFTGKAYKEAVRTEVSGYAATSTHELGGEAFADVMINGERASATSRAVFDAIERGYAKVHPRVGETFPKAAGPDFDIPARGPTAPPGYVRPSLKAAKTPRELRRVWQDEAQAATGFPFFVQAMPRGISMVTAREYAEGTLQMLERFPGARVDQIKWFDDAASKSYAQVRRGGHAIEFNMKYASETGRPKFLESRRRDAAGWDVGDTSWGVRNDTTGQGVVYHEFMHILDLENTREKIHGSLVPLLIREADREGVTDIEDLIRRRVSSYAAATTSNMQELIAEAGADVMVNGAQASQLSRSIFDLLQAEYRARGFALRVAPVDELAAEAERLGEVFPARSGWQPGEWGSTSLDQARREIADHEAQIYRENQQRFDFPVDEAYARHLGEGIADQEIPAGSQAYQNGDYLIVRRAGVNDDVLAAVQRQFDALTEVEPLRGPFTIRLGLESHGYNFSEESAISFTSKLSMERTETAGGRHFMQSAQDQPKAVYTLTHEYGHSVMFQHGDGPKAMRLYDELKLGPDAAVVPSRTLGYYGMEDYREAYAEAFTEWNLTAGLTENPMVLRYAQEFGWHDPLAPLGPAGEAFPKLAAPKALGSQTVAQLRALAKERGIVVPAATRKADLVRMLEEAPVARQAAIDAARPIADLAVRMDEIVANGASRKALLHTVDTLGQQAGGLDAAELTRLRGLVDDPAALRAATRDLAARAGADLTGATSDVVRFDRTLHEPIGDIAPGAPVEIVRPGVSMRVGNEVVPVRKATVQATDRALTSEPVVAPAPPLSRAPLAYQARQDALRIDAARPTLPDKSRRQGGANAITTRVEHEGGPPTITKDFSRLGEGPGASKRRADAEELGSLTSEAVGIRAPTVIRIGPRSVEMEFIDEQTGEEFLQWGQSASDVGLTTTDDGRLLGLADILMGQTDRNAGGFMRTAEGHLIALDHESAFGTAKLAGASDRFGADLVGREDFKDAKWPKSIDIAPQDLAVIRARLEALRPEFERLGRATWHKQVMARLAEVEKRATGTTIRLPEARADLTSITSRAAQRAEVRDRAAAVAAQRGNAALLARVDELIQAKASKAVIRQELDPALRQAEQLYAGADEGVANALRDALDSGEPAKLRAAITRQSKASGLTPIGKAGAKAKFDPATMEGVGGTAIPDGADVIVIRRGTSIAGLETPEKATVRLARPPSTAKTVAKGDFTGLTRVGEQLGGNPGGIFEAGDGSRWYVKAARNPEQLRSEALALDLYRASGLDVPDVVLGEGVGELGQGTQIASRIVEGAEPDLRRRLADEAYRAQVQEGFAVDAWLGNRDVLGASLDNILTTAAGTPIRIEAGGALRFRALGEAKDFGPDVTELDTMRAAGRSAAKVFGDMTPEQIIASAERVRKVTPTKIKALVRKHGLDPELADTLIARRADILRRAEALAGPKPMTVREYNAAIKTAAKGQDALDAVQAGVTGHTPDIPGQPIRTIWRGISDDDIKSTIDGYIGNDYEITNGALRRTPLKDYQERLARQIVVDMDRALDGSRLTADAELWRAPGSGRGIFGDPATWGDDLAGFEWSDPAYSSASAIRRIADRFTKDGGVRLRILAPKGSKALQLSPETSSLAQYEESAAEAEVLLARGARYRVVKDRGWTEIMHPTLHGKVRVRDLDVEVIVPDETPPLPWATK